MVKTRLMSSLLTVIGFFLLFIIVTFAWFTLMQDSKLESTTLPIVYFGIEAQLYELENGEYVEINELKFLNVTPGETHSYRLDIFNTGEVATNVNITFSGFNNGVVNNEKPYDNTKSLLEKFYITTHNTANDKTIDEDYLQDLLDSNTDYSYPTIILIDSMIIGDNDSQSFYFTLTFSTDASNDYQNLSLEILAIVVAALRE